MNEKKPIPLDKAYELYAKYTKTQIGMYVMADLSQWKLRRGYAGPRNQLRLVVRFRDASHKYGQVTQLILLSQEISESLAEEYQLGSTQYNRSNNMLVEKKEPRFKKGFLVSRNDFEAACAVIAQATINGQMPNSSRYPSDDDGDHAFKMLTRNFHDPLAIKAQIEEQQAELAEKLAKLKEKMETNAKQLNQISGTTHIGVDYGKVEQRIMADYVKSEPIGTVESIVKIPDGYSVTVNKNGTVTDPHAPKASRFAPPGQDQAPCTRDCAYSGFNFHTTDCDKKGPCR